MTHYPPHPFLDEIRAAGGVAAVAYGHLHLGSPPEVEALAHDGGVVAGLRLFCVACDRIGFTPRRIL
jgi:predicted phosphohydrolase